MPTLNVQRLTTESFVPFGDALIVSEQHSQRIINQGSSVRYDQLTTLDVLRDEGVPCLCLFRSRGATLTQSLSLLERHQSGSQTFLPVGTVCMLVVVAPSTQQGDAPDETQMQAFITAPGQGITIKAGIWHHPLLTVSRGDVMVLERRGREVDCDTVQLQQKWYIKTK